MKILKKIKLGHIITFLVGAILFGSISAVVATGIAASSVNYTTTANNNVQNIGDALDDLYSIAAMPIVCYNGTCGKLSYKYWNDDFEYSDDYAYNTIPDTVYASRAALVTAYGSSNFADSPVYIRSVLIDGNVVGHQACLWNNNKEFCLGPGYWAGTLNTSSANAGTQTKLKLQRDMQDALGVTIQDSSCVSSAGHANCDVGDFYCIASSVGGVYCYSDVAVVNCFVDGVGAAGCSEF